MRVSQGGPRASPRTARRPRHRRSPVLVCAQSEGRLIQQTSARLPRSSEPLASIRSTCAGASGSPTQWVGPEAPGGHPQILMAP